MEPELIADYAELAGEGPLWHVAEQRVYWVDITTSRIFRYHPASGRHELFYQGEEDIGGFTFQADGSLLLFMARGAVKVLRDGRLTTIIDEIPAERRTRFNDVIADPAGRVYCGTMPTDGDDARLYRLDTDGTLTVMLEGIGLSNGMGFTLDHRQMYFTDTFRREIYLFDYDQATGALSGQRVFMHVPEDAGRARPRRHDRGRRGLRVERPVGHRVRRPLPAGRHRGAPRADSRRQAGL